MIAPPPPPLLSRSEEELIEREVSFLTRFPFLRGVASCLLPLFIALRGQFHISTEDSLTVKDEAIRLCSLFADMSFYTVNMTHLKKKPLLQEIEMIVLVNIMLVVILCFCGTFVSPHHVNLV